MQFGKFNHQKINKAPQIILDFSHGVAELLVPLWEEWYLNIDSSMQAHYVKAHLKHLDS